MSGKLSPTNNRNIIGFLSDTVSMPVVEIDFSTLLAISRFRDWSPTGYRLRFVNVDLPSYVLNVDPSISFVDYLVMLLEMGHGFRLLNGERLVYNGFDSRGHVLFRGGDGKTYRFSATLERRFLALKKVLYALVAYFSTPMSVVRASELFNLPRHVVEEAVRFFREPKEIVIDGETWTVEWNGEKVLVVFVDGTRGGGRGLIVTASNRREAYRYGRENDEEAVLEVINWVKNLGREVGATKYLVIMDGNKGVAERFLAELKSDVIVVEHSHSTWWEVCVIYNYNGRWFTIRTRGDIFADEKTVNPYIDIPPSHIELYEGIVHVGFIKYVKREAKYIESWRKRLSDLIPKLNEALSYGDRAFREYLAWWVARINDLTRALLSRKIDITEYQKLLEETVKRAYSKLTDGRKAILKNALKNLNNVYSIDGVAKRIKPEKKQGRRRSRQSKKIGKNTVKTLLKRGGRKLVYTGPIENAPRHAVEVIKLLKKVFGKHHITSSRIEGLIGVYVHVLRNSRGKGKILTKLAFSRRPIWKNFAEIGKNLKLGRGPRQGKPRLKQGKTYVIKYRDKHGNTTTRKITVKQVKKKHVKAYCHLRNQERTFRKDRILDIKTVK